MWTGSESVWQVQSAECRVQIADQGPRRAERIDWRDAVELSEGAKERDSAELG